MDNQILEQLGLSREDITDDMEMELQSLAEIIRFLQDPRL